MTAEPSRAPRVLVSYSHDSPEHAAAVLTFAQRLRRDGVDARIDRFEPVPKQSWPQWMREEIVRADYVLVVCTQTYRRRVEREEQPGVGRGATWEGVLLSLLKYENRLDHSTLLPVLPEGGDEGDIPDVFRGGTWFSMAEGYERLVKHLLGELAVTPAPLGVPATTSGMPETLELDEAEAVLEEAKQAGPRFEGPGGVWVRRVPDFTGRDEELDRLEELLRSDASTVCVVAAGIGGVGKTALAEQFVATRGRVAFPDGVAWLAAESLPRELARLAKRFGWHRRDEPTPEVALELLDRELHGRDVLIIVDNFDPNSSELDLLPTPGGRCKTLVTSRSRVLYDDLEGQKLELKSWTPPACRDYLRARCERLKTTADADLDALANFVGRLPLGVKLITSQLRRSPTRTAKSALARLKKQPLGALGGKAKRKDQGIARTFEASYTALEDPSRRVLQALAVCARETRAEVVAAVSGEEDTEELLNELWGCSLAQVTTETDAPWGLHDVVRMFVREQPGCEKLERAHLKWVRGHLEEFEDPTRYREFSAGVAEALEAIERMLERAEVEAAMDIYQPVERHLRVVGHYPDAIALSERLLAASAPDSVERAVALSRLGLCFETQGEVAKAIEFHERSLAMEEKLGRLEGQANQLGNLSLCFETQGEFAKAIEFLERSLAIHEKLGRLEGQAAALGNLGLCYQGQGEVAKAIEFHERALAMEEKLGRLESQAANLGNLGLCYQGQGEVAKAIEFHERALAMEEKLGRLEGQAIQIGHLGAIAASRGQTSRAKQLLDRALELYRRMGLGDDHPSVAWVFAELDDLTQS